MASSDSSVSFKDVLGIIGGIIGGAIATALGGLVIGVALDIFQVHINSSSSFFLFTNGLWVGAVAGGLIAFASQASRRANAAEAERDRQRREREAAAQERSDLLARLMAQIRSACIDSVAVFECLPSDLRNARDWGAEAQHHFQNNAYSPFWHAIENAYDNLGYYNERLAAIGKLSRDYDDAATSYVAERGPEAVPAFPVQIDAASATQAAEPIVRRLNEIVYQAQRDAVFAQIWEQRRTTAAVVRGFASLEVAVSRMSSTLSASISQLNTSVGSLSASVSGMSSGLASASAASAALGAEQLRAQQEINDRMGKAVHYLKEEHKRAIGLA
ncbi:hypothetical protein [Microbacterium sp. No. 7]|uniref:hypothetical protein n=1 Tax=Microbacterium sp. No. 7 TaxID=1714373 RepID=UPI0006D05BEF|nr:hypothetical protein [Microbacterium sp. No. 7]ALJ18463.1 hypothetical protein AOA12_00435 [Microbacterium sp. No. 7]